MCRARARHSVGLRSVLLPASKTASNRQLAVRSPYHSLSRQSAPYTSSCCARPRSLTALSSSDAASPSAWVSYPAGSMESKNAGSPSNCAVSLVWGSSRAHRTCDHSSRWRLAPLESFAIKDSTFCRDNEYVDGPDVPKCHAEPERFRCGVE